MAPSTNPSTSVAILGDNTASGSVLALLLKNAGYDTKILEAPLRRRGLLKGIDLLLLAPELSAEHCERSLAVLRADRELVGVAVLRLSPGSGEKPFSGNGEVGIMPWPSNIRRLRQEIEAVLASVPSDEVRECGEYR